LSARLTRASIEDGTIHEFDRDGNLVGTIGKQYDGTHGAVKLNGPVPPTPSTPTLTTGPGVLVVEWDGRYTDPEQRAPLDFQTVEVYASPLPIESPHPALLVGTFPDPVGGLATIARSGGLWHVRLVTKSEPGRRSPMSEEVTATVVDPLDEEALEELNGSIDALERAIGEIEEGGDTLMERLAQLRTDLGEAESALEEARQGLATAFPGGPFSVPERLANTLKDTTVEYAVGPSETAPPTSGWSASTPTRTPGTYIWFRTVLTYGDDSTSMTSPALLTG